MSTAPTQFEYTAGMTVADLKELLANWPETNEDGSPCEVWLCGAEGLSNQAVRAGPLDLRRWNGGANWSADILLEHDA